MARNKFFEKSSRYLQSSANAHEPRLRVVDFGGIGDCGFRAVAASLLFNFSKDNNALNTEILTKLMESLYLYYPQFKPSQPVSYKQHLHALVGQGKIDELVRMFANVLRQLSVDYMCDFPEKFPGAFLSGHESEGTDPKKMRQVYTYIDESAIAALASALEISVEVAHRRSGSDLPDIYTYTPKDANSHPVEPVTSVGIQLQNSHYKAVFNATDDEINKFRGIRVVYSADKAEPAHVEHNDPELSEILQKIRSHDEMLVNDFNTLKSSLMAKVNAGELTKEMLIDMYIKNMDKSDYLQGRHFASLEESSNAEFFNTIIETSAGRTSQGLYEPMKIHTVEDQQGPSVVDELVHALARASAIGHIKIEQLYESVQEDSLTAKITSSQKATSPVAQEELTSRNSLSI